MNVCINKYQVWSPKIAFQHSEGSYLSDPWRSHWLQPSASSRAKNTNEAKLTDAFIFYSVMSSVFSVPVSSIQAGPSCSTSWPCFSCSTSAGAPRPVEDHRVDNTLINLLTCVLSFIRMLCCQTLSVNGLCVYLNKRWRWCRPAFVQNALGQVFA